MRKKKYGEDTIAIRIPKSRKQDVLTFLKQFEVIDSLSTDLDALKESSEVSAYKRGYLEGFKKGEETQFLMGYAFAGKKEDVQLALEVWRKRVPDILVADAMTKLGDVLLKEGSGEVSKQLFSLSAQIMNQDKKIESKTK